MTRLKEVYNKVMVKENLKLVEPPSNWRNMYYFSDTDGKKHSEVLRVLEQMNKQADKDYFKSRPTKYYFRESDRKYPLFTGKVMEYLKQNNYSYEMHNLLIKHNIGSPKSLNYKPNAMYMESASPITKLYEKVVLKEWTDLGVGLTHKSDIVRNNIPTYLSIQYNKYANKKYQVILDKNHKKTILYSADNMKDAKRFKDDYMRRNKESVSPITKLHEKVVVKENVDMRKTQLIYTSASQDQRKKLLKKLGINSQPSWMGLKDEDKNKIMIALKKNINVMEESLSPIQKLHEKVVMKERFYYDFLNKSKGFRPDRKYFKTFEDAKKWIKKNIPNANMDHYDQIMEESLSEGFKVGDKVKDSEGNIFVLDKKVKNGWLVRGNRGSKEISDSDLKLMKKESVSKLDTLHELMVVSERLSQSEVNELMKDISKIEVRQAEGRNDDSRLDKWFTFRTPEEANRHLSQSDKPDRGYNKHDVKITMKDGGRINNFRYDHGSRDPDFITQLSSYMKNNLTLKK